MVPVSANGLGNSLGFIVFLIITCLRTHPRKLTSRKAINIGLQHYSTALRTTLPCQERVRLFYTITPMFLGECLGLHFCTNEKRNECYTEELQNLQLFLICGFTLPHKKHMIKQHISKSTVTVFSYLTARSRMSLRAIFKSW